MVHYVSSRYLYLRIFRALCRKINNPLNTNEDLLDEYIINLCKKIMAQMMV